MLLLEAPSCQPSRRQRTDRHRQMGNTQMFGQACVSHRKYNKQSSSIVYTLCASTTCWHSCSHTWLVHNCPNCQLILSCTAVCQAAILVDSFGCSPMFKPQSRLPFSLHTGHFIRKQPACRVGELCHAKTADTTTSRVSYLCCCRNRAWYDQTRSIFQLLLYLGGRGGGASTCRLFCLCSSDALQQRRPMGSHALQANTPAPGAVVWHSNALHHAADARALQTVLCQHQPHTQATSAAAADTAGAVHLRPLSQHERGNY
jgi:hypothetical protein